MAGTVTTSGPDYHEDKVYTLTYEWTADSGDGSVPATAGAEIEGLVFMAVTVPGGTAPTDLYDLTLTDSDGCDVFGGELNNRSASIIEQACPKIGSNYQERYVKGALTLNLTNNVVNSATGTVKVYVYSIRGR